MLELAKGEQAHRQAVQKRANRLDWAALQQDEHEDDSQLRDLGLDLESLWNGSSVICLERNACAGHRAQRKRRSREQNWGYRVGARLR
jgi:hypothetical protein